MCTNDGSLPLRVYAWYIFRLFFFLLLSINYVPFFLSLGTKLLLIDTLIHPLDFMTIGTDFLIIMSCRKIEIIMSINNRYRRKITISLTIWLSSGIKEVYISTKIKNDILGPTSYGQRMYDVLSVWCAKHGKVRGVRQVWKVSRSQEKTTRTMSKLIWVSTVYEWGLGNASVVRLKHTRRKRQLPSFAPRFYFFVDRWVVSNSLVPKRKKEKTLGR